MQDDRAEARVGELAGALRALKERTPHSYETLAARLGVSRSALHRYCSGKAVPTDFATVRRLAELCKADRDDVAELHRLWALATEPRTPASVPEAAGQPGPESAEESQPEPEASQAPAAGANDTGGPPDTSAPGEAPADVAKPPGSYRRLWTVIAALGLGMLVLAATLMWTARGGDEPTSPTEPADNRPLFSGKCREPVRFGQEDGCVREVQELLAAAGTTIGIDGIFGPETLRRIEAFQVRAGLTPDGIAGDETKRALYAGNVSLTTWSKKRVADRVREVFTEDPDTALKIARCTSLLDPLHIVPNTDRSRNWGVFQISDARLRDLRATPDEALDPKWNIDAAHRIWAQDKDFGEWPHCFAATQDGDVEDGG